MNIQDSIIFFMEILGTIAFAASGAMVGIRKRMDIFGICVLGVVTAVGGGMTRDVILGKLPSALEKPVYVGVSVATALAIFILLYIKQDLLSGRLGTFYDKAMLGMDSVGCLLMYNIRPTTKFQKDLKRVKKRGFDISLLTDIIKKLAAGEPLPEKNRDHQLSGDYAGCRECHITPDWLLIYEVDGDELILYLTRTGSHSDLF